MFFKSHETKKVVRTEIICLLSVKIINVIQPQSSYKYLVILEANGLKHMKEKTKREYLR